MTDTIDTLIDRTVGNVRLTVATVYDHDLDTSYLGEFATWRTLRPGAYVYHRPTGYMRLPGGGWRDSRGRIVGDPLGDDGQIRMDYAGDRDCKYIVPVSWCETLGHAFANAERLERLDRGDWHYVGIVALVKAVDNFGIEVEIGQFSVWGFESDSGAAYFRSEALNIATEALSEARQAAPRCDLVSEVSRSHHD